MDDLKIEQKDAITNFYKAIKLLKEKNVIRSKIVFGDIGEFLATIVFKNLTLVKEKTQSVYDATIEQKKVQIKFSDSFDTKNINLGDPNMYDELIVILTKESSHIFKDDKNLKKDFYFYHFTNIEVKEKFKINSGYTLSKSKHFKMASYVLNIENI